VGLGGIVTVLVAVVLGKVWGRRGTLLRGGLVSAHSALAFFCFVTVCYLSTDVIVWALALILALLVAQSRIDAGIHSRREVLIGAAVALVVGVALYSTLAVRTGG
jgi:diacylglycerol kinase (ATP)